MTKLTVWRICKKTFALGLEILDLLIKASAPTTKPGASQLYGRYEDGDIGIVKLSYELDKLKKK